MIWSNIYKLSAGNYMRQLYPRYLKRWGWVYAIVVVALVLLSVVNVNFLFVALMAVLIMLPMALGFAYFFYALGENCVSPIRRGAVAVTDESLVRRFVDDDDNLVGEKTYPWDAFQSAEIVESGILLVPGKSRLAFDYIPKSAFEGEDYEAVVSLIGNKLGVED